MNLFRPGAAQRMCSPYPWRSLGSFRSSQPRFAIQNPKSLLPAAKASDIKYADLDRSTP